MDYVQLSRFSLKHLTALHVMLSTRSVTQTAKRLCVSPSNISKILAQLRELLADELFFRDGNQLIPTAFALQISPTIHHILSSMNGLIHQAGFDPKEYHGNYQISMRESTFELYSKRLAHIIEQCADDMVLTVHAKEQHGFDSLLNGAVDFVILPHDISQPHTSALDLGWQVIDYDEMICLMRPEHPLAEKTLTVENYLQYAHIDISDHELSDPYFEKYLTQHHTSRTIKVITSDFGSAADLCHHTNLLFTCSQLWADASSKTQGLIRKPLPFDYGTVAYSLVWNTSNMNNQAIKWLSSQLSNQDLVTY